MSFVCYKCKKPVYFAERIFSVGKDWHRECLRCEACNKVLTKGQHAEHKGLPYCTKPCYNRLFGPTLMRQGAVSNVQRSNITGGSDDFILRFKEYNEFYKEPSASKVLNIHGEDGEYYIQGLLRVCWGVKKAIKLQQNDNVPVPLLSFRKSYYRAIENEIDPAQASQTLSPVVESPARQESRRRNSFGESDKMKVDTSTVVLRRKKKFSTVGFKADRRIRKRYSINGHLYDSNTCVFTPAFGAVMSVTVTSLQSVLPVVGVILDKFKMMNSPHEFSLFLVDDAGALTKLKDNDLPLIERVLLGPEEVCHQKLFLMEHDADRKTIADIPPEIADFVNLPNALLKAFLEKYVRDEEEAIERIKNKYSAIRDALQKRMEEEQGRTTSTA